MALNKQVKCGVALTVLSVVMLIMGPISSVLIMNALKSGVDKQARIPLPSDGADYDKWVDTRNDDAKTFYSVWTYNMTNIAGFLATGETPHYSEHGPYVFEKQTRHFNISFSDDNAFVSYHEEEQYFYRPDLTKAKGNADLYKDQISNIWLSYFIALGITPEAHMNTQAFDVGLLSKFLDASYQLYGGLCSQSVNCTRDSFKMWGTLDNSHLLCFENQQDISIIDSPCAVLLEFSPKAKAIVEVLKMLEARSPTGHFGLEFAAFTKLKGIPVKLNAQQSEYVLVGPHGFNSTQNLGQFLQWRGQGHNQFYPVVTDEEAGVLLEYLSYVVTSFKSYGFTRPAHEWIFNFKDPLLVLTGAEMTNSAYLSGNDTSYLASRKRIAGRYKETTGHGDIVNTQSYVEYNSLSDFLPKAIPQEKTFPAVFCSGHSTTPVGGHDDTQFSPADIGHFGYSTRLGDDLLVWVDQVLRPVTFSYLRDDDVKGITTRQYQIGESSFDVTERNRDLYDMNFQALINMTCPEKGFPIYLTEPHFLKAKFPDKWKATGEIFDPDMDKHASLLSVDTITGTTFRGYERLQINVLLQEFVIGTTVLDKLLPQVWVEEFSELTDDQAHKYKNSIELGLKLRKGLFFGLTVAGAVLAVFFGSYTYFAYKKLQESGQTAHTQYSQMNEPF